MAEQTVDRQSCPRRMREYGPWPHEEGLDEWRRDRWAATKEEADRQVAEFMERNPGGSMGDPQWHGPQPQPRTCSFCGAIHPEDAIELVKAGWEVGATGKLYKRYLNPPGTSTKRDALLAGLRRRAHGGDDPFRGVPSVWSPLPPVKLYVMHLDADQAKRFNAALAKERS